MKFSKFALFCKWARKKLHKMEFSKLFCGLVAFVIGVVGIYSIFRYYSLCELSIATGSVSARLINVRFLRTST